jgi:hypothetical protein
MRLHDEFVRSQELEEMSSSTCLTMSPSRQSEMLSSVQHDDKMSQNVERKFLDLYM